MASSQALARLTPTGAALSACLVAVLVVGTAARKLAPDSALVAWSLVMWVWMEEQVRVIHSIPLFALTVFAAVESGGRMARA